MKHAEVESGDWLFGATGYVERRAVAKRMCSGKGGGRKGGHAIIKTKYLSRVRDFLGDERSWTDEFASVTTGRFLTGLCVFGMTGAKRFHN